MSISSLSAYNLQSSTKCWTKLKREITDVGSDRRNSQPHLWNLPLHLRMRIGDNRPTRVYDILPNHLRSPTFVVQFDMEYPSNQFLIVHRISQQSFTDLLPVDQRELVRVALAFVKTFDFCDSFLSIPLGGCNQVGVVYSTFYAHIIVTDVERYLRLFDTWTASGGIPFWPTTNRWVTALWMPNSNPQTNSQCFNKSVKNNTENSLNPEVQLLSVKSVTLPAPALQKKINPKMVCNDFEGVVCTENNIFAFTSRQFLENGCDVLERCQFLDHIYKRMYRYLKRYPQVRCSMRITLASPMVVQEKKDVIGFLKFENQLPKTFQRLMQRQGTSISEESPSAHGVEVGGCSKNLHDDDQNNLHSDKKINEEKSFQYLSDWVLNVWSELMETTKSASTCWK